MKRLLEWLKHQRVTAVGLFTRNVFAWMMFFLLMMSTYSRYQMSDALTEACDTVLWVDQELTFAADNSYQARGIVDISDWVHAKPITPEEKLEWEWTKLIAPKTISMCRNRDSESPAAEEREFF